MKEIIEKLSTYNIFNYLFPGILFTFILSKITAYNFIQDDILIGLFLYYFIGLVVSRIGSLIIEPILRELRFLKFSNYKNYTDASKKDEKIELFSEINNMYRTICSMFFLLGILKLYELIALKYQIKHEWSLIVLFTILFIIFMFAYRKQTSFVKSRVDNIP
ncbi:MAG: hypothetical protein KQH79_14010 [Bacteroidetes bacterium]|nr:hypothetical protein [Bacteroidota bacterium]